MDQNNKFNGNNRNNGQQYQRPQQNTQSNQPQPQAKPNIDQRVDQALANKTVKYAVLATAATGAVIVAIKGGKVIWKKALVPAGSFISAQFQAIKAKFSKKPAAEAAQKPEGE